MSDYDTSNDPWLIGAVVVLVVLIAAVVGAHVRLCRLLRRRSQDRRPHCRSAPTALTGCGSTSLCRTSVPPATQPGPAPCGVELTGRALSGLLEALADTGDLEAGKEPTIQARHLPALPTTLTPP